MSDLPRPSADHPPRRLLRVLRPVLGTGLRGYFDLHLHTTGNVPAAGPAILGSNHTGWLDGPLLSLVSPRPVHALTKLEMFHGVQGTFLRRAGQIPLDRFAPDPRAVKSSLRVLGAGEIVGIFPEGTRGAGELRTFHHGVSYLALVSGAPVVPVTQVGTRVPGGHTGSIPPRGSRIDIVYGVPWQTPRAAWPRTREHTLATSALLWDHMREQQSRALALIGRSLPGPLPPGDAEMEPETGFVERPARPASHREDHHHDTTATSPADQQGAS